MQVNLKQIQIQTLSYHWENLSQCNRNSNRVTQFFEYQGILEDQRVLLASFHLEGESILGFVGFERHKMRALQFLGHYLKKNYLLILGQLIMKILMRLSHELNKWAMLRTTNTSLNGLLTMWKDGPKRR